MCTSNTYLSLSSQLPPLLFSSSCSLLPRAAIPLADTPACRPPARQPHWFFLNLVLFLPHPVAPPAADLHCTTLHCVVHSWLYVVGWWPVRRLVVSPTRGCRCIPRSPLFSTPLSSFSLSSVSPIVLQALSFRLLHAHSLHAHKCTGSNLVLPGFSSLPALFDCSTKMAPSPSKGHGGLLTVCGRRGCQNLFPHACPLPVPPCLGSGQSAVVLALASTASQPAPAHRFGGLLPLSVGAVPCSVQ